MTMDEQLEGTDQTGDWKEVRAGSWQWGGTVDTGGPPGAPSPRPIGNGAPLLAPCSPQGLAWGATKAELTSRDKSTSRAGRSEYVRTLCTSKATVGFHVLKDKNLAAVARWNSLVSPGEFSPKNRSLS